MRYFIVTGVVQNDNNFFHTAIRCESYPSEKSLREELFVPTRIIIINIIELNKTDYESFTEVDV